MGEGTLAYELQDALTRRLAPELLEQPNRERLTYEWTFLLTHLYNLEQGQRDTTLLEHPELVDYAVVLTANMAALDGLSDSLYPSSGFYVGRSPFEHGTKDTPIKELVPLKKIPALIELAHDTYYAHNGLHETEWRINRLRTIADIMDYHLASEPYEVRNRNYLATSSQLRLAASVHEEIASLEPGSVSRIHNDLALKINERIVNTDAIPWYDQQKVHALFSKYDIEHRQALRPLMGEEGEYKQEEVREYLRLSQLDYYDNLLHRVDYIDELLMIAQHSESKTERIMWSGRAHMLGGTLTEIAVLGEIRDEILARGLQLKVEARQAFLREDHNPRVPRLNNPQKAIATPNFSFDHVLQYHGQRGPMSRLNVEVKKSSKPDTYLATTYVLSARDDSTSTEFTRRMRLLCEGKMAYYTGRGLSREEAIHVEDFRRRINASAMIDELLDKSN